ncbi:uncharacterized protein LOC114362238 [Ostrinia furnacalis]|uniref:uncharacterized protein LOC114362238 n=1 Tax=Ostrinia furnacalis TaxID=93504 RepID=UPI00103B39C0|nr:uncharacterized protein LOC114362238 [Ostrinia furnacalis]
MPVSCIIFVVPEDVPAGFATIYGFSPRLLKVNDHRFGFGFRLGNQADFQVMYELGPQMYTKPLQPVRVRSATYRERVVRRRPLLEFLLNLGILKETSYSFNVVHDDQCNDEPR